jgi:hypothetical protein
VSVAVVDDLDAADSSYSFEEFLEITFGDIIGEVSDVNAAVFDGGGVSAALPSAFTVAAVAALGTGRCRVIFAGGRGFGAGVAGFCAARFAGFLGIDSVGTALGAWWADGFLVEAYGLKEFLPPVELDGSGHRATLGFARVLTCAGAPAFAFTSTRLATVGLAAFCVLAFGVFVVITAVLPSA